MNARAALLGGLLAASGVAIAAEPESAPAACRPRLTADIPIHYHEGGLILVPVRVQQQDVLMALNFSTGLPWLHESGAATLKLEAKPMNNSLQFNMGGERIRDYVKLDSLQIGSASFGPWEALALPSTPAAIPADMAEGRPLIGSLGARLLPLTDLEIDLPHRRLRLFEPNDCNQPPADWSETYTRTSYRLDRLGIPVMTFEIDGRRIDTTAVTGSSASYMDIVTARKYFGFDDGAVDNPQKLRAAREKRSEFYSMTITGAGLDVQDTRVVLRSSTGTCRPAIVSTLPDAPIRFANCLNRAPVAIGNDLLRQMRLYFTSRTRKLFVMTVGAAAEAPAPTAPP